MMNVTENAEKGAEKAPHSDYLDEDHVQKKFASLRVGNQMGTPPPPYSLTSPCLPPIDTQQQRWSPEPPPSTKTGENGVSKKYSWTDLCMSPLSRKVPAALIAFWALVVIIRAAHLHSNYKETERIEF
uniref:Uncharacterized protein n=1 Tax=Ascaris lumbricoides TaxID=6252 RepID=A0A0M3I7Y8_ASCLU